MTSHEGSILGRRLVAARDRRGWSRETLAHEAGVSWSAIAQIESGRRQNAHSATLVALATALEVPVYYLLGRSSPVALFSHSALIYGSREEFLAATIPFVVEGVHRDEPVLVVTTPVNRAALRDSLGDAAGSVRFEDAMGWYRSPPETAAAYQDYAEDQAAAGAAWIRIIGEPLWPDGADEVAAWARYESLLNATFAGWPLSAICPYDAATVPSHVVKTARRTHPRVVDQDGAAESPDYQPPHEFGFGPST